MILLSPLAFFIYFLGGVALAITLFFHGILALLNWSAIRQNRILAAEHYARLHNKPYCGPPRIRMSNRATILAGLLGYAAISATMILWVEFHG